MPFPVVLLARSKIRRYTRRESNVCTAMKKAGYAMLRKQIRSEWFHHSEVAEKLLVRLVKNRRSR